METGRSWMYLPRRLPEYEFGVVEFLNASFSKVAVGGKIRCPCKRCKNRFLLRRHEVSDHLKVHGFVENYYLWIFHGEEPWSNEFTNRTEEEGLRFHDGTDELLTDTFRNISEGSTNVQNGPNDEAKKFYRLVEDGKQELFPGCKNFSKLSFIIRLFLFKTLHGISNVAFDDLIQLLKEMVPEARFLGTIGRDYKYAPLTIDSWRKVPNKEKMWEYILLKYMVPAEGKDWVMRTIGSAWRVHKCRFKRKHYYSYTDDKSRWQNRPKTLPDEDFHKLLSKWKKKAEKMRCSRNKDHRLSQRNMHTIGAKSFAVVREEMRNEHPTKEAPSLAEVFERTRKRNEGKQYNDSYDDTAKKIEDMKHYVAPEDGSGPSDAYLGVMGRGYNGFCRLYGRGVSNKKLKMVNGDTSYVVPGEILESLKASLITDIREDMDSKINEANKRFEDEHLKKMAELEKNQRELEHNQRELDAERENMTQAILHKLLGKLPPEIVKQYLS